MEYVRVQNKSFYKIHTFILCGPDLDKVMLWIVVQCTVCWCINRVAAQLHYYCLCDGHDDNGDEDESDDEL